jgi:hypothetical protein
MVIYLSDYFTRQRDITLRKSARLSATGGQRAGWLPERPPHVEVSPGTLFADSRAWRLGPFSAIELNALYAEATLI